MEEKETPSWPLVLDTISQFIEAIKMHFEFLASTKRLVLKKSDLAIPIANLNKSLNIIGRLKEDPSMHKDVKEVVAAKAKNYERILTRIIGKIDSLTRLLEQDEIAARKQIMSLISDCDEITEDIRNQ